MNPERFPLGSGYDDAVRAWAEERGLPWWPVTRTMASEPSSRGGRAVAAKRKARRDARLRLVAR